MQKNLILLVAIFLLIFTSGCGRLDTVPSLDLSQSTLDHQPLEESITLTPTPALGPATEQALRLYPLFKGTTWVYDYLGYDLNQEVVWRVVERVTDIRFVEGYYVAVLERNAELLEGNPPADFLSAPDTGTFWYLVDGQNLYRFESQLVTQLSNAWLDLVLPFPEGNRAWFPDRSKQADSGVRTVGFRYASAPFKKVLPLGGTYTCYNVFTHRVDGREEGTFCESVGFVFQEFDSENYNFGYRLELRGFSIQ